MTTLVLTPDRNKPGKHDFLGAFRLDAEAVIAKHGGQWVRINQDKGLAGRKRQTIRAIRQHEPDTIVYCGHGLKHALPQIGVQMADVYALAEAIAEATTAPRIVLYACSAGDGEGPGGDGGIADHLRDTLCQMGASGARVFAHATAGHSSQNPYVRLFTGPVAGVGSKYVIDPGAPHWERWKALLDSAWRYEFPWLTMDEVKSRLEAT